MRICLFILLLAFPFAYQVVHAQWVQSGLMGTNVYDIKTLDNGASGTTLFAATDNGIYRSTDNGINWFDISKTLPMYINTVTKIAFYNKEIFASTGSGIFRSTDGGESWTAMGLNPEAYVFSLVVIDTNLFVGTVFGVYRSTILGTHNIDQTTWTQVLAPDVWTLSLVAGSDTSGTYLLVGAGYEGYLTGVVYLSRNNGTTWNIISSGVNGIPTHMVVALATSPDETGGSILFAGTWFEGVFRSTNYGESWKVINSGLTNTTINSLSCFKNLLFAGTCGDGLFISADSGESWDDVSLGLPKNSFINTILVSGQDIWVGTSGSGVWRRPLSEMLTSVDDLQINAVSEFNLGQNYPNPFNPSTKISWQSPVAGPQTLKIYDVLGNEVATLVNEEKPAGSYEVDFNASGLSSGVYFYKLQAVDPSTGSEKVFVETKKMILIR
jgi:photosystem II stability/assembly factor-like uncharacterized protein